VLMGCMAAAPSIAFEDCGSTVSRLPGKEEFAVTVSSPPLPDAKDNLPKLIVQVRRMQ